MIGFWLIINCIRRTRDDIFWESLQKNSCDCRLTERISGKVPIGQRSQVPIIHPQKKESGVGWICRVSFDQSNGVECQLSIPWSLP